MGSSGNGFALPDSGSSGNGFGSGRHSSHGYDSSGYDPFADIPGSDYRVRSLLEPTSGLPTTPSMPTTGMTPTSAPPVSAPPLPMSAPPARPNSSFGDHLGDTGSFGRVNLNGPGLDANTPPPGLRASWPLASESPEDAYRTDPLGNTPSSIPRLSELPSRPPELPSDIELPRTSDLPSGGTDLPSRGTDLPSRGTDLPSHGTERSRSDDRESPRGADREFPRRGDRGFPRSAEVPRQRDSRITPPWQADDLPIEPQGLRLVEPAPVPDPALSSDRGYVDELSGEYRFEPPALRLVEPERPAERPATRANTNGRSRWAAERERVEPPQPAAERDESDGDLLIFAAARSAWFTDWDADGAQPEEVSWENSNDVGWRAAQQASNPLVGDDTHSGLPRRVPQQNLVPGSPVNAVERPLRIVRDAAQIAAHTTGYFRGWQRGQEVGGFSVGGRPGRESAGGWDFSREGSRDYQEREYEYRSARR